MKNFVLILCVFGILFSSGCSNSKTQTSINKVNKTIEKVHEIIYDLKEIPNNVLVINDISESNNNIETQRQIVNYSDTTQQNLTQFDNYINKLYILKHIAQDCIDLNQESSYLLNCVSQKGHNIQNLCSVIINQKCNIDSTKDNINDLCNDILLNINRIAINKDDLKSEASSLISLKRNYSSNIDRLSKKYNSLINSFETQNGYLNNIYYSMDDLYGLLYDNCYNSNNQDKKTSNIDTYKNARTTNTTNNNDCANNNYNNNYAYNNGYQNYYGANNPYYRYGGFGMMNRFGGAYGYPYSPITNYNPYMPNIDTYGRYSNVDTFMPENNNIQNQDKNNGQRPYYDYNREDEDNRDDPSNKSQTQPVTHIIDENENVKIKKLKKEG